MLVKMYPCCSNCGTIIPKITVIKCKPIGNMHVLDPIYYPRCCPKCKEIINGIEMDSIIEKDEGDCDEEETGKQIKETI